MRKRKLKRSAWRTATLSKLRSKRMAIQAALLENVMRGYLRQSKVGQIQIVPRVLIKGGTDGGCRGNNALMVSYQG